MNRSTDPNQILQRIAKDFQTSTWAILDRKRNQPVANVRLIAMAAVYELSDLGMQSVATLFGCRDHATVCNARKRTMQLAKVDKRIDAIFESFRNVEQWDAAASSATGRAFASASRTLRFEITRRNGAKAEQTITAHPKHPTGQLSPLELSEAKERVAELWAQARSIRLLS